MSSLLSNSGKLMDRNILRLIGMLEVERYVVGREFSRD